MKLRNFTTVIRSQFLKNLLNHFNYIRLEKSQMVVVLFIKCLKMNISMHIFRCGDKYEENCPLDSNQCNLLNELLTFGTRALWSNLLQGERHGSVETGKRPRSSQGRAGVTGQGRREGGAGKGKETDAQGSQWEC